MGSTTTRLWLVESGQGQAETVEAPSALEAAQIAAWRLAAMNNSAWRGGHSAAEIYEMRVTNTEDWTPVERHLVTVPAFAGASAGELATLPKPRGRGGDARGNPLPMDLWIDAFAESRRMAAFDLARA